MDRYAKIKKLESLQILQKNLQKLLNDTEEDLKAVSTSEIPILISSNIEEDNVYYIYYLADLDRVVISCEFIPNTIDLQEKLHCSYNILSINKTKDYLNSLINKIIINNNVNNWIEVGILLEKKLNEFKRK